MNSLPLQYLITLAAAFDGVLYVVQPPNSISGSILFDRHNDTWRRMDSVYVDGIKVLKTSLKNISITDNVLPFKIKFYHKNYSIETRWQSIVVDTAVKIKKTCESNNTCKIVNIILSITLFAVLITLVSVYSFIYWCNK